MGNTPDLASQIVSLRATLAIPGLDPQLRAGLEATLRGLEAEQARQAAPAIHSPTAQRDVNIATQQTITNFLGSGPETPGLDLATLRREYAFPRGDQKFRVIAIYSTEPQASAPVDGGAGLACAGYGSAMHMTASMGLLAAGCALDAISR